MNFRIWRYVLIALAFTTLVSGPARAQVSGRITGTVVDPSGGVIVNASITLTNGRTGEVTTAATNEVGAFVFPTIPPSNYTVQVKSQGYSTLEKTGLVLSANQSLALGNLQLSVGSVTDTVTVSATGATVEIDTSGQNALLTDKQLGGLMSRGRDIVSLMTVLPGVSQNTSSDALGGNWGTQTPNMQGMRSHWNSFLLDGQPGSDIDALDFFTISVSMDAIEEVSVKSSSYLAEDGRAPGTHVNIVSKSGTKEFHGSGYTYKRHEQFNANNFFNNRLGVAKPLTRYNTYGGTFGGPIFIPGKFNASKDKLFFFVSREDWRIKLPAPIWTATVPTAAERTGDFSQSRDQNGALILVKDPLTGQQFPGNIIPTNRLNSLGRGLLSILPAPNFSDQTISKGAFNYRAQENRAQPKVQTQLKLDYNLTDKDKISFRPRWWSSDIQGQTEATAASANFFLQQHHYEYISNAYSGVYTRTFSANVVNEFNLGYSQARENGALKDGFNLDNVRRDKYGLQNLGQLFPSVNPLNLIPKLSFGGLPNSPAVGFDNRTPIAAADERLWFTDNLSWVKRNHSLKFGVYYEMNYASEGPRSGGGGHMGSFNFSRDGNNPLDSNHPFANALLGNFASYSEANKLVNGRAKLSTLEFYAQDSWKVNRKLNLDYGVRFYSFTPWLLRERENGAAFSLQRFQTAKIPRLYLPAIDPATGKRVALNPITKVLAPAPFIGAFVPDSGDSRNGIVLGTDTTYAEGFRERPPLQLAPRVGFAYDVFGTGKTALRGGFAVTKQAIFSSGNSIGIVTTSRPVIEIPSIFNGSLDTFKNVGQAIFPANAGAFDPNYDHPPTVYQWSLGIQQNLGFGTVLDATYTGNTGRHLRQNRDLNTLPRGARFLPSSLDPTTNRPLPDVFLRPYLGYQTIQYIEDSGYSNYNALQVAINRRYTSSLQFGLAYTFSKAMGISDNDGGGLPMYTDYRSYLYGKLGYDQTHVLVLNYLYSLPNKDFLGRNKLSRAIFHHWDLAGIGTMASGFPGGINFSYTDGVDRQGGGDAPRVIMKGNPLLAGGDRSFTKWFNTAAFAAPGVGQFGNAPRDVFRGPGIHNWDLTLSKNFPIREKARFQFRWELYNLFNHTQWSGVDNNARFDAAGNQVNGQFGQVTAARASRQMQFALRFEF